MAKRSGQPKVGKAKKVSSGRSQPALKAFKKAAGKRSGGTQPKF